MKHLLTIAASLIVLAVAAPVSLAAAEGDIGKTTTFEIAKLALARYPHGITLKGGNGAGYCDPYAHTLPTKITCQHPANHGQCFTQVIMNTQGNATGEVTCGYPSGPKKGVYVWRVYYGFKSANQTYSWRGEVLLGKVS